MSTGKQQSCGGCASGLCGGKGKKTMREGLWENNAVFIQVLGICSALAVTNKVENALIMGLAVIFTCTGSNLFVSLLRNVTPSRIRMIAELTIIAVFVITVDQLLKAFYWDMSKQLGPYVGLIITNCIVMGRAEAFALQNPPILSMVDGVASGIGYAAIMVFVALLREIIGAGEIFGSKLPGAGWYLPNQIMILAPGAFFTLALLLTVYNGIKLGQMEAEKKS